MADPSTAEHPHESPPPQGKPRRVRRWILIGLGTLLLLVVLLIALAPTVASTGWGRGLVLGQVNQSLNGTVSMDSWSLGWFSPIRVHGVVVRDAAGQEVIKLKSLETELTALEAARMKFDAGQVNIDGLWIDARRDENGELNLAGLAKPSDEPETASDEPTTLPDLRATLTVSNSGGTYTDAALGKTVGFDLSGDVAVADINQPIKNNLQLVTRVGQGPPGTIALDGETDIAENNQLEIDWSTLKQSIKASGVDLAGLAALLPPGSVEQLSGTLEVALEVEGGEGGPRLEGSVAATDLLAGFNGDVLRQRQVRVDIPRTVVRLPRGGQGMADARISVGRAGDENAPLRVVFDQGQLSVRGDMSGDALARLAANERPGAAGEAVVTADVEVGPLAQMLRNTMALNEDLDQLMGTLAHTTTLTLAADSARIETQTRLTEVSAVRDGRQVTLKPITLDLAARSLGGGGSMPDLRDMRLALSSGFANADITGRDLGSVSGIIRGSLDEMQRELSQFVEFGDVRLAGGFEANPSINGNLLKPGGNAQASIPLGIDGVVIEGIEGLLPIRLERLQAALTATLVRGGEGESFLRAVRAIQASVQAGNRQSPGIDLIIQADAELSGQTPQIPRWEITRGTLDLPALQRDLPQLAQAIQEGGARITSGRINLAGRGAYADQLVTLRSLTAALQGVTMQTAEGRPVIERTNVSFDTVGKIYLGDDATRINLTKLDLVEQRGYLSLKKTSGGELALVLPADGGFAASAPGEVEIGVSLGFANQVLQAFGDTQLAAQTQAGQIQQGFLEGTLRFEPQAEEQTRLAGNLNIRNLVVTTEAAPLDAGNVTLVLEAATANDATTMSVARLDLGSSFANVNVSDVVVNLAAASAFEMVRSANVRLDVPDAGRAWAVKEAFAPATATPATDGGEPVPPLHVAGGRINADAAVSSQGGAIVVALRDMSGEGVRLTRGPLDHTLDPFKLAADARMQPDADGGIAQLAVSRLSGNFGFANIELSRPLQVAGLGEGEKLTLNGTIRGDANVEPMLAVVNLLTGSTERPAYAGRLTFTQAFETQGDALSATTDAVVSGFRTLGEGSQQINDDIRLTGGVGLNLADESMEVRNVRLQMPGTRAIDLQAQGTIQKYSTERQLDLAMTLKTDWEKLWQMIYPMLPPDTRAQLADAKAFGIDERSYKVGGTYPADQPAHEAIRSVVASGGFGIKSFQGMGADVRDLDAPFELKDGRLTMLAARQTVRGQYTPNAQVNGGVLNLMNIVVDLTHPDGIRINTPENYKLLVRASMNPALSDRIFGKFVNPMMADAKQARGQVDVIIEHCENFNPAQIAAGEESTAVAVNRGNQDAFDAWRQQQAGGVPDAGAQAAIAAVDTDPGRLQIRFSVTEMQLGSPTIENLLGLNIVNANIKDSRLSVSRGVITSRIGININDQGTIQFNGAVRAIDSTILNMVASYPKSLLPTRVKEMVGDTGLRALPESFALPMSGPMGAVQFDLMGAVQENLKDTLLSPDRLGDTLGDLLNRNRRDDRNEGTQPQQQPQPQPRQAPQPQTGPQAPIGQQPIGRPRIEPRNPPAGPQPGPQPPQPPPDRPRIEPRDPPAPAPEDEARPQRRDPLGDLIRGLGDREREDRERREREQDEPGR